VAARAGHRPPDVVAWLAMRIVLILALAGSLGAMVVAPARAAPFAAVVMDARTGEILHSVNHTTRLHPASLTKMMTLYVVFEAIRNGEISLDTRVRISRRAASEPPSRLGLREGQQIAVRHLIRAAALRSGNDAATAIAEAVSGSVEAFAQRMNRTAAAIGMTQTSFRNAHGLTQAGHMSTARDMTILGRQLFFDFPEYYALFSRRVEDAGIARVQNTNSRFLDGYRGADGIKTGFTNAAGYNLTAMAERDGVRIIVTVFGGRSIQHRHDQTVALMDRGFRAAPTRAAVRRPARPEYGRPTTRTAAAAPAEGRAAGRVIRLQTAPARSVFPRRRPDRPGALPEARLAAVQSGVEATLAALATPPPPAPAPPPAVAESDPDLPDQAPVARQRGAPERSPLPQPRPAAVLARAVAAPADPAPATRVETEVAEAVAAGFTVISAAEHAAATGARPDPDPDPAPEGLAAAEPITEAEPPEQLAEAAPAPGPLPARARRSPAPRPFADMAPEDTPLALAEPADSPVQPAGPEPSEPGMLADAPMYEVEDGQLVIPGLPPIPLADAAPADTDGTGQPVPDAGPAGTRDPADAPREPGAGTLAGIAPDTDLRPEAGLLVTGEGRILWRDEDLLTVIDDLAPPVAGPAQILLTDDTTPRPVTAATAAPVLNELAVRVSTSGNQVWTVDLGRFGSRFDAERTLLRIALSESAALGGGVRRVVESGGGYRAMVMSLTQDQAERACLRLTTAAQPCNVVSP